MIRCGALCSLKRAVLSELGHLASWPYHQSQATETAVGMWADDDHGSGSSYLHQVSQPLPSEFQLLNLFFMGMGSMLFTADWGLSRSTLSIFLGLVKLRQGQGKVQLVPMMFLHQTINGIRSWKFSKRFLHSKNYSPSITSWLKVFAFSFASQPPFLLQLLLTKGCASVFCGKRMAGWL